MSRTRITIDRSFTTADAPHRPFGSFVEHLGRCVYTGIHEPGHPETDERGRRKHAPALTLPALSGAVVELEVGKN